MFDHEADKREEYMQDKSHEELVTSDFDYAMEQLDGDIEIIRNSLYYMEKYLTLNGWCITQEDVINEVMERL
jgi:hypothetical protein